MLVRVQLCLHQVVLQRGGERALSVLRPTTELVEESENLRGRKIAELCEDVHAAHEVFVRESSARFDELWQFRDVEFRVDERRRNDGFSVDDESRPAAGNPTPENILFSARSLFLELLLTRG